MLCLCRGHSDEEGADLAHEKFAICNWGLGCL